VNVRVKTTGCDNAVFTSYYVCARAYDQLWINTIHNIRVACFPNANNETILDTNISLEDTGPIDDEGICNNSV
jgi:hypothetical protein